MGTQAHYRFVAACLMLAILSWVESLALPMPPAGHSLSAAGIGHSHGMSIEHPCCPHTSVPMMPQPAPQSPTGDLHRCCFLRAPVAPPPAGNQKIERPKWASSNLEPSVPLEFHRLSAWISSGQCSPEAALRFLSETSVVLRF